MSTAEAKAVAQRFIDMLNSHSLDAADSIVHEDCVMAFPGVPLLQGREAMKQLGNAYFAAFPDMHMTIEDLIGEDELVVRRLGIQPHPHGPPPAPESVGSHAPSGGPL